MEESVAENPKHKPTAISVQCQYKYGKECKFYIK